MSLTNCPHCTSPIPEAFASMPVCSICGGDLSAAPAAPVWASIDIKTDNTRKCHSCGTNVKSILALDCPECGASLAPAGKVVEDIEKEKAAFESAVSASNSAKSEPSVSYEQQRAPEPKPKQANKPDATLKSSTAPSEIKPYSEMKKEKKEDFVSIKDRKKKKEGFFTRLLRMLGLKKD